jgi:hypothetical protein
MPAGLLFLNRVHAGGLAAADAAALERAAVAAGRERAAKPLLAAVAARAREEIGWSELNARHRARLVAAVDLPLVELPFVFAEEFGPAEVRALAARLAAPQAEPVRRRKGGRA